MNQKIEKPPIILILGMHRSGTSLVAQMVAKWGAYMGDYLMPADWYNQEGYWEYIPLVNLNEKILSHCNSTWYAPPVSLDVQLLIDIFGNEANELVNEMDKNNTVWCWKDPRMGILLPFWKEILKTRNLIFIYSNRNPLEVASSLHTREKFPTFVSVSLWEFYVRKIIQELNVKIHFFNCEYEQLIKSPKELSKDLFDFLNTEFNKKEDYQIYREMLDAVNIKLKHSSALQYFQLDPLQQKLFNALVQNEFIVDFTENKKRISYTSEILSLFYNSNFYKENNLFSLLFYSKEGEEFTKENSIIKKIQTTNNNIIFELQPCENIYNIRFEPINEWAYLTLKNIEFYFEKELVACISEYATNATTVLKDGLFFANQPPQFYLKLEGISFDKVIFNLNIKMYGNELRTYFAENIGLFFENVIRQTEQKALPDNSFSTLQNQLSEYLIDTQKTNNRKTKTIAEIGEALKTASNQVVTLSNINHKLQESINILSEQKDEAIALRNQLSIITEKSKNIAQDNFEKDELIRILKNKIDVQEKEINEKTNRLFANAKNAQKEITEKIDSLMSNERYKLERKYKKRLPFRLITQFISFCYNPLKYYRVRRDSIVVRKSGLFDDNWYLKQYSDLYLTTVNLLQHYMLYGWKENRNPNPYFDANYYINNNPDIKEAGINPLLHFILHGSKEGRKPNKDFDPKFYLEANPDVKDAGINPLLHYMLFGKNENRSFSKQAINENKNHWIEDNALQQKIEFNAKEQIIKNEILRNFFFKEPVPILNSSNHINYNHLMIHWVIPDFPIGSGGHMTIFRIIKELERNGCKNTIWIHNIAHKTPLDAYTDIINYFQKIKADVKFIDDNFAFASGDAIFATDWASVAYVNSVSNFKRRFYFVQDHESEFNATGSMSLLAQQTYRYDLDCICAGKWLEKVVTERYGRWARSFNLAIDHNIYYSEKKEGHNGKVRIAFYARFSTPRRAVELAFLALERLAVDTNNFEVHCYGGEKFIQHAPFDCYWHGVLAEEELAKLYRYCDIGIVFSATNYSLVPQEMMACGLAVAEIDTECNRIVYPSNSITLLSIDPSKMVNQLKDLISDRQKRENQVVKALSWIKDLSWKKSGNQCHKAIIERLKEFGYGKINHNETKRLAIFASHDVSKIIDPYVTFYIKELSQFCDIIFVTDYDKDTENIEEIQSDIIKYINEFHQEYDFGSYKRGYRWATENLDISSYDWIILCNDSVFGPLFDLSKILIKMEESHVDFWGFTKNNIDIVPHLQSYFIALNRDVFLSEVFKDFLYSIKEEQNKRDIVIKYEHYLTKNLVDAGFTHGAFFEEEENEFKHDPMKDWNDMILDGFPFIKKRLFTENEYNLKGLDTFQKYIDLTNSKYCSNLIIDNLDRTFLQFDTEKNKINTINEIFLHVGLPKTGSTSIQWYLFNNNEALIKKTFLYPKLKKTSHSTLFYNCFAERPELFRINKIESYSRFEIKLLSIKLLNKVISEINKYDDIRKLIFSGEELCFLNKSEFESIHTTLKKLFPKSTIKIIFYTRNPGDFFTSGIQQIIRSGEQKFERLWLENTNMFKNNIEKFKAVFGDNNLYVRNFDNAIKNKHGIIGDFLECIGIDPSQETNIIDIRKNTSFSNKAIDLVNYINEKVPLYLDNNNQKINPERISFKMNLLSEISGEKFRLKPEILDQIWENQKKDLLWLKNEYNIEYKRDTREEVQSCEIVFDETYHNEIMNLYPKLPSNLRVLVTNYLKDKMKKSTNYQSKKILEKTINDLFEKS